LCGLQCCALPRILGRIEFGGDSRLRFVAQRAVDPIEVRANPVADFRDHVVNPRRVLAVS
jgi:hypothetical protein